MSFKYSDHYREISASNPFDDFIEIKISCSVSEYILLDMNKNEERKALADLVAYINTMLWQHRQKYLEELGYEKPGPNAVTVGDLAGLKREV